VDRSLTSESELIDKSSLGFADPDLPIDFSGVEPRVTIACNGKAREVQWQFKGEGSRAIQVTRFEFEAPYDVRGAPADSWVSLQSTEILGKPAILLATKTGQAGSQLVYLADANTMTILIGNAVTIEELIEVAGSATSK
jgi:hypothetical protein